MVRREPSRTLVRKQVKRINAIRKRYRTDHGKRR